MAHIVKVWFDPEADFIEVLFSDAPSYMHETNHDAVMERIDKYGNVVGFSILGVSSNAKGLPLEAKLASSSYMCNDSVFKDNVNYP